MPFWRLVCSIKENVYSMDSNILFLAYLQEITANDRVLADFSYSMFQQNFCKSVWQHLKVLHFIGQEQRLQGNL